MRNKVITENAVAAGADVYSKSVLSIYNLYVLGFSNTFAWRCPSRLILDFYNEHISDNHLDVGVGTGYFLDRCQFPTPNYLLHCLPGNFLSKGVVFENLKPLLGDDGGVIFGTTILGKDVRRNVLAKALMWIYNAKGIFSNVDDNAADLASVLKDNFGDYAIRIEGCVAFFVGRA